MARVLSEREYRSLKWLERRFQGDMQQEHGLLDDPPREIVPLWQWVEVTSEDYTIGEGGTRLFPGKPVLWYQEGAKWDRYDPIWVRGPKDELLTVDYYMARRCGPSSDGIPVWVCDPRSNTTGQTGTGTGTGTSRETPPCGEAVVYTYRYRCESGNLNEYRTSNTVSHGADGCLEMSEGQEVYMRTLACCDASCAADGTGTATSTATSGGSPSTVFTDCCSLAPRSVTITLSSGLFCACVTGLTGTLTYNSGSARWEGIISSPGCTSTAMYVTFRCEAGGLKWRLGIDPTGYIVPTHDNNGAFTCSPFSVSFTSYSGGSYCGAGTINAVVTE